MKTKLAIKHLTMIMVASLSTQIALAVPHNHAHQNHAANTKGLTSDYVPLLNSVLERHPISILKIKLASREMNKSLAAIDERSTTLRAPLKNKNNETTNNDEALFVSKQLENIMKPVEEFFDKVAEYKSLLTPLVEESLKLHGQAVHESMLMHYLEDNLPIKEFCKKNIHTPETLEVLCTEVLNFFNDITDSLSPRARQAYDNLLAQLKKR